ncbi:type II toxin-antitoxin system Phd/YefM family antitoxin [Faecalicatena contorta]|uniref:type II toxin-antitoxin system Phd/YefM family antitoxin n=1 Tax=Faecalicatena contorta TaxID=39482 RepID=UPI002ED21703
MHKCRIIMLPMAEEDIARNTDYIAYDKKSPETVLHLLWGFRDVISKLDQNPDRHELDEDRDLALYGIRKHYYKKLIENIVVSRYNMTIKLTGGMLMFSIQESIRPSADLRNHYSEISKQCRENNEAVIITVNGRGDTVSLSYEEYKRMKSRIELLEILSEAEDDVKNGMIEPIENTFQDLRKLLKEK